jgi:hypothetical protein
MRSTFPRAVSALATLLTTCLAASCGSGGGGSGGGGGDSGGPPDTSQILPTVGLLSVAAGEVSPAQADDGLIQARWDARELGGAGVQVGLFLATDKDSVYLGAPVHTAADQGSVVLNGLPEDQVHWLGLAVDEGGGQYRPVGVLMSATPGTVIYVDAASAAVNPDGSSPATAFPVLIDAVLVASGLGGAGLAANVWVAGGTYADVAVPLNPGVHVYGSFPADFDLSQRDPLLAADRSVLVAQSGKAVAEVTGGDPGAVLDGFEIDGTGATFGVDVDSSPARLSALEIRDCAGRGIRLRSLSTTSNYRVTVARCAVTGSGAQGLSLEGAFKLDVEGSRFSVNGLEGIDLNDLVAPDGVTAGLEIRDSVFFGNGEEGVDCDLGAPPLAGAGSSYSVLIDGSRFERNGWKPGPAAPGGLRIDIEYEAFDGWSAEIVVRGCTSRANLGPGFDLDLDAASTTFLHRILASANGGDGLLVTSESAPALAIVSTSILTGNRGAGARAGGATSNANVPVLLSHSIVAGNGEAGLASERVESSAASSVAWLQPAPWSGAGGVRERGLALGADPLDPVFTRVPVTYREVVFFNGFALALDDASDLVVGDLVEVADDGQDRFINSFTGPFEVVVDGIPSSLDVPALFTRFEAGGDVIEDWSLVAGSAAEGAGMPPPAGPAPDAGVFGAPLGGAPGDEGPVSPPLFRVGAATPPTTTPLATGDDIAVAFAGGTLDSLTIPGNVQVRDGNGDVVTIPAPVLVNDELVVSPPGGGWPVGPLTLELFSGLETTDTPPVALAVPVALPFVVE